MMSEFEPTPEDHPTAIAYAAGFRAGQAALSAPPTVQPSDEQILDLAEKHLTPDFGDVLEFARALFAAAKRQGPPAGAGREKP